MSRYPDANGFYYCAALLDREGNIVSRTYGETEAEKLQHHQEGTCDMWCQQCYFEATGSYESPTRISRR